jgi:hypothetical protein
MGGETSNLPLPHYNVDLFFQGPINFAARSFVGINFTHSSIK